MFGAHKRRRPALFHIIWPPGRRRATSLMPMEEAARLQGFSARWRRCRRAACARRQHDIDARLHGRCRGRASAASRRRCAMVTKQKKARDDVACWRRRPLFRPMLPTRVMAGRRRTRPAHTSILKIYIGRTIFFFFELQCRRQMSSTLFSPPLSAFRHAAPPVAGQFPTELSRLRLRDVFASAFIARLTWDITPRRENFVITFCAPY